MRHAMRLAFLGPIMTLTLVAGAPPGSAPGVAGGLTDADRVAFADRFTRGIWPLMAEPSLTEKGCLACHRNDQSNTSPLVFSGSPSAVFASLLDEGYFDRNNPSAILTRVAHKNDRYRMPPVPARSWSRAELKTLRTFVAELNARRIREEPVEGYRSSR
ncbi:hypothetical protein SAMN05444166_6505 [Singulisphaera sp. GP187]|uniref:hypothetical protein n=1 Tax=Singulisphaera sp. GP187 TaxID=1882752 RepID=UPI0009277AAC|nr:hypothetical protein [Singulisphaera sp. GP187]SIO60738.1 hypothetical protein SAMN05444166_6505 [Singulisphaera sp. GP187]